MIEALEQALGYTFRDKSLLRNALTHSSYANEMYHESLLSNERLEFLGDSILGMVVAEFLYRSFPDRPEGELTRMRADMVCENTLAEIAHQLDLDLSRLFIPDYTEHRIIFLQLSEILQYPVYITAFRQLHPVIQNRLQYRCRRTLLHPKPLSRISPGKSCHSTDTAFFCFLHHLVLVPGINPDLVNFLLHRFFLCHIFQDFFNLQYSVCDLHMCQTAAL